MSKCTDYLISPSWYDPLCSDFCTDSVVRACTSILDENGEGFMERLWSGYVEGTGMYDFTEKNTGLSSTDGRQEWPSEEGRCVYVSETAGEQSEGVDDMENDEE